MYLQKRQTWRLFNVLLFDVVSLAQDKTISQKPEENVVVTEEE